MPFRLLYPVDNDSNIRGEYPLRDLQGISVGDERKSPRGLRDGLGCRFFPGHLGHDRMEEEEAVNETEQKWACPPPSPVRHFLGGGSKKRGKGEPLLWAICSPF